MSENLQKNVIENNQRLREKGAIWPLTLRILIRASGSDVVRFLNGQITNDLKKLTPQNSIHSAIVTPKGKLCAEIYITTPDKEHFYIDGSATSAESLLSRLEKYLIADDVTLENLKDQLFLYHAWGKITEILPTPLFKTENNRLGFAGVDFFYQTPLDLSQYSVCTENCVEQWRIEAGIPRWGTELTENTLPPEIGFEERWISYQKGCYTGQEVIARLKSVGHVNRLLMGLDTENQIIQPGQTVQRDNKSIGEVTSAIYSSRLEKGIALAYIHRQSAQHGFKAYVENHEVTLVKLPFI